MIAGQSALTPAAESRRRSPPGSRKLEIQSRRSRLQIAQVQSRIVQSELSSPGSSPDCRRSTLRPGRRSPPPAPRAQSSRPTAPTATVKQAAELRTLTQRAHSAGARHGAGSPPLMPQVASRRFNEKSDPKARARRCGPGLSAAPQCSARSPARVQTPARRRPAEAKSARHAPRRPPTPPRAVAQLLPWRSRTKAALQAPGHPNRGPPAGNEPTPPRKRRGPSRATAARSYTSLYGATPWNTGRFWISWR